LKRKFIDCSACVISFDSLVILAFAAALPANAADLASTAQSNSSLAEQSKPTVLPAIKLAQASDSNGNNNKQPSSTPPAASRETSAEDGAVLRKRFELTDYLPVSDLHPIKLDGSYNQSITLKEALTYTLQNNLPIRISKESWNYQRYQFLGALAGAMPFLPTLNTGVGQTWSKVAQGVRSNSFVFQQLFNFPVFQGGSQFYSMLAQFYREKGWRQAYYANINDALLDVYAKYEKLVLQHSILRIKAEDLKAAKEQLEDDCAEYVSGTAPLFEVMQGRTEMALSRHELLEQQLQVRKAALDLALSLNMPVAINLVPMESVVSERLLIDELNSVSTLMKIALEHRPELRQFQYFRLAASRNIPIQAAPLYPNISFFAAYSHAQDIVNPPGGDVSGLATAQIASTNQIVGAPSNNALGETPGFTPDESKTATSSDINTIDTSVVAASGGLPLNLVQAGSLVLSGAVAPSIATPPVVFNGTVGATNLNGANTSSFGVFPGTAAAWQFGFLINFMYYSGYFGSIPLAGQGFPQMANVAAARNLARQALLQANQGMQLVDLQVRAAYLSVLRAREKFARAHDDLSDCRAAIQLIEAQKTKEPSNEDLDEDLENAEHNLSTALSTQAESAYIYNIAQARILHDVGVISIKTLTEGFKLADVSSLTKRRIP